MPEQSISRWPHRIAWLLASAALASIWLGGNVTSYQSGMAIPDWPAAWGHWLWYPPGKWWPAWDLRLDYAHRLSGRLVVLTAVGLAAVAWKMDRRRWMQWLVLAAVAGAIAAAVTGGLRVILQSTLWAAIHAAVGAVFFGLSAALVALSSTTWQQCGRQPHRSARRVQWLCLGATISIAVLILLGILLRHLPPEGEVWWFQLWVWLKLLGAGLTLCGLAWLLAEVLRRAGAEPALVRRAQLLLALFLVQAILGAAAWVTHYEWPRWFTDYIWAISYTVVAEGRLQAVLTTAHVTVGSLALAASLALTLWSFRMLRAKA